MSQNPQPEQLEHRYDSIPHRTYSALRGNTESATAFLMSGGGLLFAAKFMQWLSLNPYVYGGMGLIAGGFFAATATQFFLSRTPSNEFNIVTRKSTMGIDFTGLEVAFARAQTALNKSTISTAVEAGGLAVWAYSQNVVTQVAAAAVSLAALGYTTIQTYRMVFPNEEQTLEDYTNKVIANRERFIAKQPQ